jgi:hypothetical protein
VDPVDREQRFAPHLQLYLAGNPLGPSPPSQAEALRAAGVRVHP